jgi:hypothetical protein
MSRRPPLSSTHEMAYLLAEQMIDEMFQSLEEAAKSTDAAGARLKATLDRLKQQAEKTAGGGKVP